MTATLMPMPVARFFTADGSAPLSGGKVYTYIVGTSTPLASYTDATGLVQNSNPIILDSTGSAAIWISGNYKVNVTDANDVQQPNYPVDNVADFHTIDNITATSTTSLSIATTTATRIFTTQTDKFFTVGFPVYIVANGAITNNMYGQVTAYSGTQLTVGIQSGAGSGTFADWTISLSGPPGPTGSAGGSGAGTGDMLGANNLSDVVSASISRTNLGLGTAATHDVGTSSGQIPVRDASGNITGVWTLGTAKSTSSGTEWDFTSIPSTANIIKLSWFNFSTSGTSLPIVQVGTNADGFITSTYAGNVTDQESTSNTALSAGFTMLRLNFAATTYVGTIELIRVNGNSWLGRGNMAATLGNGTTYSAWTVGSISLGSALDRIRLTMANGTDHGDSGTINIMYS